MTSRAITDAHVRAIRGRLALLGVTPRELARRIGVSDRTVYDVLGERQAFSRFLEPMLEAVGLDPLAPRDDLAMHADLIDALRAAGRATPAALRTALAALTEAAPTTHDDLMTATPNPTRSTI